MSQKEAKDFINLGVILNDRKEILMVRRRKKETGNSGAVLEWAFPGGKQRFKETREQCVVREVLDETGYQIEPERQISMRVHPELPVFIVYHLCGLKSKKPVVKPKEPHEIAEIRWVKKQDIINLITTNLDSKVSEELGLNSQND